MTFEEAIIDQELFDDILIDYYIIGNMLFQLEILKSNNWYYDSGNKIDKKIKLYLLKSY